MGQQTEQAVENTASVEDRITDKFDRMIEAGSTLSKEQPEEAAPESEEPSKDDKPADEAPDTAGSEFVEVEFGGSKYNVPPELKDALMATVDYTRKTTELSQVRRNVEIQQKEAELYQQQRRFQDSVADDLYRLRMYDEYITTTSKTTNWAALSTTDAFNQQMELSRRKEERDELQKQINAKYQGFRAKFDGERAKLRKEIGESLAKSINGWSDESKGAVEKYAASSGYSEAAAQNLSALDYQVLWKAMQFDKLKSDASKTVQKAATPTITPSARKEMPKTVQNQLNYRNQLKKTSDPKARQKLAEERLGQIFGV